MRPDSPLRSRALIQVIVTVAIATTLVVIAETTQALWSTMSSLPSSPSAFSSPGSRRAARIALTHCPPAGNERLRRSLRFSSTSPMRGSPQVRYAATRAPSIRLTE